MIWACTLEYYLYFRADDGGFSRNVSECQAAVAAAIHTFGRVDVLLCCTSQGILIFARLLEIEDESS